MLDGRITWPVALAIFIGVYLLRRSYPLGAAGTVVMLHLLYGLVAMLIAAPGIACDPDAYGAPGRLLNWQVLRWIGLVSYGFYLYHTIVISRVESAIGGGGIVHYPLVSAVSFVITAACATASYYLAERPILRAVRLRSRRQRVLAPTG